eukprot:CAMPEP_0202956558 /NCGR_PEP_ID=MMETSP1396-20130829/1065_1 /ASSEMBLY_ACC=CAM_ASM_000872 /TAXON_ID= /ORGANISM="Pseudokeronopsis sp., Strain Brazil" /LENGTH=135 /DNA_ID=CAMNT_0049673637 /DNA_START=28 /DNA_END=435 /DNA_ORIENTATION=+
MRTVMRSLSGHQNSVHLNLAQQLSESLRHESVATSLIHEAMALLCYHAHTTSDVVNYEGKQWTAETWIENDDENGTMHVFVVNNITDGEYYIGKFRAKDVPNTLAGISLTLHESPQSGNPHHHESHWHHAYTNRK